MATFFYRVRDAEGNVKTGTQDAASKQDLARLLADKGYAVTSVEELDAGIKKKKGEFKIGLGKVSLVEKIMFTRNLAVMIGAGLSLSKAVEILAIQTSNVKFQKALSAVSKDVQKGETFAAGLEKHKKIFPDLYVNMVKIGETAGNLQQVLGSLAVQMKKDHDVVSRVKGALMYPSIILIAMTGIGALMMTMVVPSLAKTFEDIGTELPASTQFIISLSNFLVNFWYIAILILTVLVYSIRAALKTEQGKQIFDKMILKAPIFGRLSRQMNSARFSRTLAILIESGVPIVNALDIISKTLTNYFFAESLREAAKGIQQGKQLHEILKQYENLYPPMVFQMVEVGEETGALTKIMSQLADFYEEEVENVTKNLSTIIEPILMVVIGAAVGFFAISMITPMYSVLDTI